MALIYVKQEKYTDAISLYKQSLELLTDDMQKVITWNRLGNAYRHLQEYQEAVHAYKCADELRIALSNSDDQTEQSIASETESLSYEVLEEQCDYPYNSVEYLYEMEPEFIETPLPLVPVEAEITVEENQRTQNDHTQPANKDISYAELDLHGIESVDFQSEMIASNDAIDEKPSVESEIELSAMLVEQDISEKDNSEQVIEITESEVVPGGYISEEIQETQLEETGPTNSEIGDRHENDAPEVNPDVEESIAQTQENVEPSSLDSALSDPQTEYEPEGDETDVDFENLNSIAPAEDEINTNVQNKPNLIFENPSINEAQQIKNDDPDRVTKDIGVEEKKLARQIEINPRSASTWEALGTLYKTAGRYEAAIQAFEQAISIAPREVSYFHNLGLVYAAQGNNQEAFNTFQKVLELDPNHSLTHASLGGYYKKMGLDELAQKHIGKAMKHIYESENEYNRACLDAICGNTDKAIDLLRTALENEQTYVDWVLNDPDLDPLRDDDRFKQLIADFSK